jgi:hypothetical protein
MDKSLDYYIKIGAVLIEGVDETGEIVFKISEKAKEVAPELWAVHSQHVDEMLMDLFERDLISISYNEDLEAIITLSEEGRLAARELGFTQLNDN